MSGRQSDLTSQYSLNSPYMECQVIQCQFWTPWGLLEMRIQPLVINPNHFGHMNVLKIINIYHVFKISPILTYVRHMLLHFYWYLMTSSSACQYLINQKVAMSVTFLWICNNYNKQILHQFYVFSFMQCVHPLMKTTTTCC